MEENQWPNLTPNPQPPPHYQTSLSTFTFTCEGPGKEYSDHGASHWPQGLSPGVHTGEKHPRIWPMSATPDKAIIAHTC